HVTGDVLATFDLMEEILAHDSAGVMGVEQVVESVGAQRFVGGGHSILPFFSDSRPWTAPVRGSVARMSMLAPEKSNSTDSGTWVSWPARRIISPVRESYASHSAARPTITALASRPAKASSRTATVSENIGEDA